MCKGRMYTLVCVAVFVGALLLMLLVPFSAHAASKQVVILIVDRVSCADLRVNAGPLLAKMLSGKEAGVGVMNSKTAADNSPGASYITLGAGSRALGSAWVKDAVQRDREGEKGAELFRRYNGQEPPQGEIYHLYPSLLQSFNSQLPYMIEVGALGESLRKAGLNSSVIGCSGSPGEAGEAVALAMDADGAVAEGELFDTLVPDQGFPGGWKTSPQLTWQELQKETASLVVVEWGDTARIDSEADRLTRNRRQELLRVTMLRLDIFLNLLLDGMKDRLIMLVVPSPPAGGGAEARLTPVLVAGKGVEGGLLTSSSTRRMGLVTNLDIAPTALSFLGVPSPDSMLGSPIEAVPGGEAVDEIIASRLERIGRIYQQRPPLLKTYVLLQIVALAGGLVLIFLPVLRSWWRKFFIALILFPLVLLLPIPPAPSLLLTGLLLAAVTAALTIVFYLAAAGDEIRVLLMAGGATALAILFDQLVLGGAWIKDSFLGYDPVAGARYYGIGNEYMGVLIGSVCLAAAALLEFFRNKKLLLPLAVILALAFFTLASPAYGANFGGAVSSVAAFALLILLLANRETAKRRHGCFLLALLMALGIGLILVMNVLPPEHAQSHLGRAVRLVSAARWDLLGQIVSRKVNMNVKLLRYSPWSRVLIFTLVLLPFLFYRPVGELRRIFTRYPYLSAGMASIMLGSVTALVVNDSGVVAAATCLIYLILPLLFLMVGEGKKRYTGNNRE